MPSCLMMIPILVWYCLFFKISKLLIKCLSGCTLTQLNFYLDLNSYFVCSVRSQDPFETQICCRRSVTWVLPESLLWIIQSLVKNVRDCLAFFPLDANTEHKVGENVAKIIFFFFNLHNCTHFTILCFTFSVSLEIRVVLIYIHVWWRYQYQFDTVFSTSFK